MFYYMILVLSIIRSSDQLDKSAPIRRCIANYQSAVLRWSWWTSRWARTIYLDGGVRTEGCEPVLSFLMSSDVRGIRHANTHRLIILIVSQGTTRHLLLSVLSVSQTQSDLTNKHINRKLSWPPCLSLTSPARGDLITSLGVWECPEFRVFSLVSPCQSVTPFPSVTLPPLHLLSSRGNGINNQRVTEREI